MRKTLHTWFRRVAYGELPDLPARPRFTKSSGEDQRWHAIAQDLHYMLQRALATLTWDGDEVLVRKHPHPSWRPECEKAIRSVRMLCEIIISDADAARSARPFLEQALQAGDALVQAEAALGAGEAEAQHAAYLRRRQGALKRASQTRSVGAEQIVTKLKEIREGNASRKRPITFSMAVHRVAQTVLKPNGKPYSIRTIRRIAKAHAVDW